MSIAVSAVLKPSKLLLCLVLAVCLLSLVISGLFCVDFFNNAHRYIDGAIGGVCVVAVFGGVIWLLIQNNESRQIDISGTGQIRMTENRLQIMPSSLIKTMQSMFIDVAFDSELVVLVTGTTLWTHLLLLRLKSADDRIKTVIIFPDCTNPETFRKLSVAFHWIVIHEL